MDRTKVMQWRLKSPERHITLSLEPVQEIFVIEAVTNLKKGSYLSYLEGMWKQASLLADFVLRSKFKLRKSVMALSKEAAFMVWTKLGYALLESGMLTPKEYANIAHETIINAASQMSFVNKEIEKIKNEKAPNS